MHIKVQCLFCLVTENYLPLFLLSSAKINQILDQGLKKFILGRECSWGKKILEQNNYLQPGMKTAQLY